MFFDVLGWILNFNDEGTPVFLNRQFGFWVKFSRLNELLRSRVFNSVPIDVQRFSLTGSVDLRGFTDKAV